MKTAINSLFSSIQNDLQRNLEADRNNTLTDSSIPTSLKGSGSIPFNFHLNEKGEYNYAIDKYGAGKTVHIVASISEPDAIYDITVKSSDGGGGHWTNVKVGQKLECNINTSFWHSTKITVYIKASVTNKDGKGKIDYSY